jgi:ABC-type multidrug transport system fused ATPase/permease subunit
MNKNSNKAVLGWIYNRSKRYIPSVLVISLLAAFISVLFVGLALVSKTVLEIATGDQSGNLLNYGVLLSIFVILQVVCSGVESYLKARASGKFIIGLRKYLFEQIGVKKYSEISKHHSGDLLNRITGDVEVIQSFVVGTIPSAVSMVTKIIGCVAALIWLEPKVAILVLLVGILVPAFGRLLSKRFRLLHKEVQRSEGLSRSFMQECFMNLSVMKTFKSTKAITDRLDDYMAQNYRSKIKRSVVSIGMHLGLYSLFTIGYYAVLVWGAMQIANPEAAFTFGTLTAFMQLISQLRMPLQNVSGLIPQYYSCIASAERLMEIEVIDNEKAALSYEQLEKCDNEFKYILGDKVCFSYGDDNVLNNCSFKIDRGSMTAIMGESGTGKSTLFKLLLSLYQADSGSITFNGDTAVDAAVRGMFAYVPQGNMIISGSIRENIAMCNPDISEEEIIKACKIAEIYDYIEALPNGIDTILSEKGSGLSEGQLQRIAIARAIVAQSPILLLDEATSALDKPTEAKVLKNIKDMADKTVILVTHRTSNLNLCDNIINLSE